MPSNFHPERDKIKVENKTHTLYGSLYGSLYVLPRLLVRRRETHRVTTPNITNEPPDLLHERRHVDDPVREDVDCRIEPRSESHGFTPLLAAFLLGEGVGGLEETFECSGFFAFCFLLPVFVPLGLESCWEAITFIFLSL